MPGNIVNTVPTVVMPMGLMTLFQEEVERKPYLDEGYAQGESTRMWRTIFGRHRFHVSRRLTDAEAAALRTFYLNTRDGRPFWFYNLRECQPVGAWDPDGAATAGRYAVVWDGPLVQSVGPSGTVAKPGRGGTSEYQLREVVEF